MLALFRYLSAFSSYTYCGIVSTAPTSSVFICTIRSLVVYKIATLALLTNSTLTLSLKG